MNVPNPFPFRMLVAGGYPRGLRAFERSNWVRGPLQRLLQLAWQDAVDG